MNLMNCRSCLSVPRSVDTVAKSASAEVMKQSKVGRPLGMVTKVRMAKAVGQHEDQGWRENDQKTAEGADD